MTGHSLSAGAPLRYMVARGLPEQVLVKEKTAEPEPDIGGDFQKQQWRMPNALQVGQVTVSEEHEANASPGFIHEDGKQQERHDRPLPREVERPCAHQRQGQSE